MAEEATLTDETAEDPEQDQDARLRHAVARALRAAGFEADG
ncbi:MAG TPA: hypothetical protein VFM93_12825 [Candidatus Limnocylindria bacterium]|nr:hypothetical protein [Candidatus Limnocylindria bacterium]